MLVDGTLGPARHCFRAACGACSLCEGRPGGAPGGLHRAGRQPGVAGVLDRALAGSAAGASAPSGWAPRPVPSRPRRGVYAALGVLWLDVIMSSRIC